MIKYFFMGCGAIILLIAFIKYLIWTISNIKYRFFTRYTDEIDMAWCYAHFDDWCFIHKMVLLCFSILIVLIGLGFFLESLGIVKMI